MLASIQPHSSLLAENFLTAQDTTSDFQIEQAFVGLPFEEGWNLGETTTITETSVSIAARAQVDVLNKIDPFGLRKKYSDDKPFNELLDTIEERLRDIDGIDLSEVNFSPLADVRTDGGPRIQTDEIGDIRWINLERLLGYMTDMQHPLRRAQLTSAKLARVNLKEANLEKAYLDGADLRGANLRGANLIDTSLCEAHLEGADLKDAFAFDSETRNILKGDKLKKYLIKHCAVIDDSTKF